MPDLSPSSPIPLGLATFWHGPTVGELMAGPKGRKNGFDSIRLLAALTVIVSHAFLVTSGAYDHEPIYWLSGGVTTAGTMSVGVFFIISGLLISASFDRSRSLRSFVSKRALRILPALFCAIALLVLVLGPLVTSAPLTKYFSSLETWVYFRNAFFLPLALHLPGIFENHTLKTVNESIWTLKFEVFCYVIAACALSLGRWRLAVLTIGWLVSFPLARFYFEPRFASGLGYYVLGIAHWFRFFGSGMMMYLLADRFRLNPRLAVLCLVLVLAATQTRYLLEVAAVCGAYCVITFGFLAPLAFCRLTSKGDVSYGVYVYGWPIQQLLWPVSNGGAFSWLVNAAIAIPLTLIAGLLSWVLVERPFLHLKGKGVPARQQGAPASPAQAVYEES